MHNPLKTFATALLPVIVLGCAPSMPTPEAPTPRADRQAGADPVVAEADIPEGLRTALEVDTVLVSPDRIELMAGERMSLSDVQVRPLDAAGAEVLDVPYQLITRSQHVTTRGNELIANDPGAAVLYVAYPIVALDPRAEDGFTVETGIVQVPITVTAGPVASLEIETPATRVYTGGTVELGVRATGSTGAERPDAEIEWTSGSPQVATVGTSGLVRARRPGRVTITATSEGVSASTTLQVVANPVVSITLIPEAAEVRTGDVVRFRAEARDERGRLVEDAPVIFAVETRDASAPVGAAVFQDGAFVAEQAGTFRVVASVGGFADVSTVVAAPRDVRRRIRSVGTGLVSHVPTSDLWVFRGRDGRDYAYTGTHAGGQKMFAFDVTDAANPVLTDSIVVDARVVNDVKVNEAATIAVITREGASDRRNGIVILDISEPAHPREVSRYTATLTGGVHNTFIVGDLVYAVHNGTLDVHIIDISDPADPREVGRWGIDRPGKYLHDIWVKDGIGYASYWDDGVYLIDLGGANRGGTPTSPVVISSYQYRTQWGPESFGNTHVIFPYTNGDGRSYLFVGDEIFGCVECQARANPAADGPRGHVHVIDATDPENLVPVAFYKVPEAGVHNLWVEDDKLYAAYYQAGLRVVDVSGELRGDLYAQGREIGWFSTGHPDGLEPNMPQAWGPQPYRGNIFVSDLYAGLWVVRLEPEERTILP